MDTLDLAMQSPLKAVGEADNILMRLVRQIGRTASTVVITKSEYKMIQTRYESSANIVSVGHLAKMPPVADKSKKTSVPCRSRGLSDAMMLDMPSIITVIQTRFPLSTS
jgi:hypothetical protein